MRRPQYASRKDFVHRSFPPHAKLGEWLLVGGLKNRRKRRCKSANSETAFWKPRPASTPEEEEFSRGRAGARGFSFFTVLSQPNSLSKSLCEPIQDQAILPPVRSPTARYCAPM